MAWKEGIGSVSVDSSNMVQKSAGTTQKLRGKLPEPPKRPSEARKGK